MSNSKTWIKRNCSFILKSMLVYVLVLAGYFFIFGLKVSTLYQIDYGFSDSFNLFNEINDFQSLWLESNFDLMLNPFFDWMVTNNLITLMLLFTVVFIGIVVLVANRDRFAAQINKRKTKKGRKRFAKNKS